MNKNQPQSLTNLLVNRRQQYKQDQKIVTDLIDYIKRRFKVKVNIEQTSTQLIILVNSASDASHLRLNQTDIEGRIDSGQKIIIKVTND